MLPIIKIYNKEIPTYTLFCVLACIISLFSSLYIAKYHKIKKQYIFYAFIFEFIGILIGARIYFILSHINKYLNVFSSLNYKELLKILMYGFSFLGAYLGGSISVFIFSKIANIKPEKLFAIFLPSLIIFYGIAKIGCFCAGCCYSIQINQRTFPIQLIESIYNIVSFLIIAYSYKKTNNDYKIIGNTLVLFGVEKFIFEFFRGNKDELMFYQISISQYFSIIIIILGTFLKRKDISKLT